MKSNNTGKWIRKTIILVKEYQKLFTPRQKFHLQTHTHTHTHTVVVEHTVCFASIAPNQGYACPLGGLKPKIGGTQGVVKKLQKNENYQRKFIAYQTFSLIRSDNGPNKLKQLPN